MLKRIEIQGYRLLLTIRATRAQRPTRVLRAQASHVLTRDLRQDRSGQLHEDVLRSLHRVALGLDRIDDVELVGAAGDPIVGRGHKPAAEPEVELDDAARVRARKYVRRCSPSDGRGLSYEWDVWAGPDEPGPCPCGHLGRVARFEFRWEVPRSEARSEAAHREGLLDAVKVCVKPCDVCLLEDAAVDELVAANRELAEASGRSACC